MISVNPVTAMLKRPLHAQFGPKVLAGLNGRTTVHLAHAWLAQNPKFQGPTTRQ